MNQSDVLDLHSEDLSDSSSSVTYLENTQSTMSCASRSPTNSVHEHGPVNFLDIMDDFPSMDRISQFLGPVHMQKMMNRLCKRSKRICVKWKHHREGLLQDEFKSIIECGIVPNESRTFQMRIGFFDAVIEVFTADVDKEKRILVRPAVLAKKLNCSTSRVGMFLHRCEKKRDMGIFQSTGYMNKPQFQHKRLRSGAYFLSINACRVIESQFRRRTLSNPQKRRPGYAPFRPVQCGYPIPSIPPPPRDTQESPFSYYASPPPHSAVPAISQMPASSYNAYPSSSSSSLLSSPSLTTAVCYPVVSQGSCSQFALAPTSYEEVVPASVILQNTNPNMIQVSQYPSQMVMPADTNYWMKSPDPSYYQYSMASSPSQPGNNFICRQYQYQHHQQQPQQPQFTQSASVNTYPGAQIITPNGFGSFVGPTNAIFM